MLNLNHRRNQEYKHHHVLALLPDGEVRFVASKETIDVTDRRFQIWTTIELKEVLGHDISFDDQGVPVLIGDSDYKCIKAMALLKDEVLSNPKLSGKEKRKIVKTLKRQLVTDVDNVMAPPPDVADAAIAEVDEWMAGPLTLGRPDGSQLDRMRLDGFIGSKERIYLANVQSFVVAHNWAGAISQADIVGDGAGELSLPFPESCFEFVISGKRVMALMQEDCEDSPQMRLEPVVRTEVGWALLQSYSVGFDWKPIPIYQAGTPGTKPDKYQPVADLLIKNIWAICVMLEAQLVERQAVRIDAKLNEARARRGKLPLHDYHVVSLNRRDRVAPRPIDQLDPDRDITRKRWHLVRAHWRQYAGHRTKIPWHSRGDMDLGVIDKHYKL